VSEPLPGIRTSNFEKYSTRNPLARALYARFFARLAGLVEPLRPASVLDAGCGEGETIARLGPLLPANVTGFDNNPDCIAFVGRRFPQHRFSVEDIYRLPYADESFDLVLCLEVLEHLSEPERALAELCRVARRDLVVSVPSEPWWSLTNLARLKYVSRLGNHPEHVQRWNRRSLGRLLAPVAERLTLGGSYPWLIAHLVKKAAA
jgi:ubiquinone/menaquinone biosynthesis C-methylase UbiE